MFCKSIAAPPSPQRGPTIVLQLAFCIASVAIGTCSWAEEPPAAGRPWFVACLSSLDQLQNNIDAALQAADQPELAEIVSHRLKRWGDLEGIDRKRAIGLARFWPSPPEASPEEVLFIPASDRPKFMKTVTFDVVEFARRADDHYVIARPEVPYHVLFRNDVGWMGDRVATLQSCAAMHSEWTSELVRKHDVGLLWDLRQVPMEKRTATAEVWQRALEPLLQKRDDEPDALFQVRRAWSEPLVKASALAIEQTRKIVLQLRFDAERKAAVLEVRLVAEPRSEWAALLRSWRPATSPWQGWSEIKDVRSAGFITGLPGLRLGGESAASSSRGGQMAWQVFGDLMPLRTAVLAVSDGPVDSAAVSLATTQPASKEFGRVRVPDVPNWVRTWIGGNTEAWFVREKNTAWVAFGAPELARAKLDAALEPKEQTSPPSAPVCLSARIPLRECLDAIPWFNRLWMEEQLTGREDRIDVTVTPVDDGLLVRAILPSGAIRILGGIVADDLAKEAEWLFRESTE
uniref:Uncharacterized protein n=1 Tax=Schlesneria paludicola TaxID=360056 RepID=A0A7C2JZI7_9PLAN